MFDQVKLIVTNAYRHYLAEVLAKNLPEKHEEIRSMFDRHMGYIARYCIDNYMNKSELSEDFIKGLHKSFFPAGYTQSMKMEGGGEVIYMIPGQYKTINNTSRNYTDGDNKDTTFLDPSQVKENLKQLIQKVNIDIAGASDKENMKDDIFYFILDFLYIHPFGDANGRVACILADIMLVKHGLQPIYFYLIKEKNLGALYKAVELSRKTRDLKYLYEVIDQYGNQN